MWQDRNNAEKELNVEDDGKEKHLGKIKERCKKWRKKGKKNNEWRIRRKEKGMKRERKQ